MASAEIGSTGLSVTRLGLGGAGPPGGSFHGTTAAAAHATLERAYELGVRYFDTAPTYGRGRSETLFGEFLSGVPRGEFVVTIHSIALVSTHSPDLHSHVLLISW